WINDIIEGCGNTMLSCGPWGIVLETLEVMVILISWALLMVFFILICKIKNCNKRKLVTIQFLFLLYFLGVFPTPSNPVPAFLFEVLFALCFSCLLTQAFKVLKLLRGKSHCITAKNAGLCCCIMNYVVIVIRLETWSLTHVMDFARMETERYNTESVMHVLCLMALTFVILVFTFCWP
uniref:Uncharacterized protein n=1 Tax=Pelodiscus sinensis TaxID=13735 RepID=K7FND2_PELSI